MSGNTKEDDLIVCRCEEVTLSEIRKAIRLGLTQVNEVKRLTRAGQGLCQGKTCGRLVIGILARETKQPYQAIKPSTFRPPTRAVPLAALVKSTPEEDSV